MNVQKLTANTIGITNTSSFGKEATLVMNMSFEDFQTAHKKWKDGTHIQYAFPMLSAPEREFLMSGITPEDWDTMFAEKEEN